MTVTLIERPEAHREAELVARCLRRDRGAERELFRAEWSHVHATLHRLLGPNRDLEDLAQETFVQVFASLASFRGEARLSTWISRIAAHVAYRYLARKKPTPAPLQMIREPAAAGGTPDDRAHARHGLRRLYELLATMDAPARVAFILHAVEGWPITEVARIVESTAVTTRVRIWRARRQLERAAATDPALAPLVKASRKEPR